MKNKLGFTLLELLVVVLIIAILAAIALPQYKKSLWRTRAKSMLPILKSMTTSIDVFYMTHNIYPTKFDELDINIEGYTKSCSRLGSVYQSGGCKANDYLNLFINTGFNPGKTAGSMFQFNKGVYKGAGFFMNGKKSYCYESAGFILEPQSFCKKIMGCEGPLSSNYASDLIYSCPDLT